MGQAKIKSQTNSEKQSWPQFSPTCVRKTELPPIFPNSSDRQELKVKFVDKEGLTPGFKS